MGALTLSHLCKFSIVFATFAISNTYGQSTSENTQPDAAEKLALLRNQMLLHNVSAYIVTDSDAHQTIPSLAIRDQRTQWLTGFLGNYGTTFVTMTQAAVWVEERYRLQAERELSENWILMISNSETSPSVAEWAKEQLSSNDTIGFDPVLLNYYFWSVWTSRGMNLVPIEENLVDKIWTDQPEYSTDPAFVLPDSFAGQTREEKLAIMRTEMSSLNTDLYIVTTLDEIAWITNLRGSDIPYQPYFRSYLLITNETAKLYLPSEKQTSDIVSVLATASITVHDYDDIWTDLPIAAAAANAVLVPSAYSYALGSSYKIYNTIPQEKVYASTSPALFHKYVKNDVEAAGMRHAYVKDAVAVVQLMGLLEREVAEDVYWDELKVVETLRELRSKQEYYYEDSFNYTSAFGPNAALPNYVPNSKTNLQIVKNNTFMLDSGGQYFDGTTKVTRTMHYGTPTEEQIATYTALLMGSIDYASLIMLAGVASTTSDIVLREPLYKLGKDYGHVSGYGVGAFLGVLEAFDVVYIINFFGTHESGYYYDNEWGMRLGNVITVVPANTTYEPEYEYRAFETVTLVPYERNLINVNKLSDVQLEWLNNYHERVRTTVGDELLRQGDQETYDWLVEKTALIEKS